MARHQESAPASRTLTGREAPPVLLAHYELPPSDLPVTALPNSHLRVWLNHLNCEALCLQEGYYEVMAEYECYERANLLSRMALEEVTRRLPELRKWVLKSRSARRAWYRDLRLGADASESRERLRRAIAELTYQLPLVEDEAGGDGPAEGKVLYPDAPNSEPGAEQFVTRRQIAALVQRNKETVADWFTQDEKAPQPAVEGGGGKCHEYLWHEVRPWLEGKSGRNLPHRFPDLGPR